jgi:cobalamin biosynthesis Mg chelatase CobN
LQVDEIKNLLKSILKGKSKEIDPEDMLIEPLPKVTKMSKKKKKPAKVIKISKKKKPVHRSRSASSSSRSEGESSERSGRSSSSSSSHSSSRSPSPSPPHSPARQEYIHYEDMEKDFKNALRVSILFVYLPNCILTDLYFTISRKFWG